MINTSITKLVIADEDLESRKALLELLSKLPNLETLIAPEFARSILFAIMKNCQKLKTLSVEMIDDQDKAFVKVQLPSVKNLIICSIDGFSTKNWKNLTRAFPNLKSLCIHESDRKSLRESAFDVLTKRLKKIKHFMFGKGFKAKEEIFNKMLQNCENLQTVKISQTAFSTPQMAETIKSNFQKPGLQFICYSPDTDFCHDFDDPGCPFWKANVYFDADDDSDNNDFFNEHEFFGHLAMHLLHNRLHNDNNEHHEELDNQDIEMEEENAAKIEAKKPSTVLVEELD